MTEFGHFASIGGGFCIDAWGAGPFVITDEKGGSYRFEDSDRFGPSLIDSQDDIADVQPNSRSLFWRVHRIWVRQGRRLQDDGITCIWDEPKPTTVVALSKRSAYIIENGEEDGKTITLPRDEAGMEILRKKLAEDDGDIPKTTEPT